MNGKVLHSNLVCIILHYIKLWCSWVGSSFFPPCPKGAGIIKETSLFFSSGKVIPWRSLSVWSCHPSGVCGRLNPYCLFRWVCISNHEKMARKFSLKSSRLKLQASRCSGGDGRESSWNQQLRGALPCMANSPLCIVPGPGLSACAFEHLTKTFSQIRMVSHMGPATTTQTIPFPSY